MSKAHAIHNIVESMEDGSIPYELGIALLIIIFVLLLLPIIWSIFGDKIKAYIKDAISGHSDNLGVNKSDTIQTNESSKQNVSDDSAERTDMQYCVYCGEKIPADSCYCVKCGRKVPQDK